MFTLITVFFNNYRFFYNELALTIQGEDCSVGMHLENLENYLLIYCKITFQSL